MKFLRNLMIVVTIALALGIVGAFVSSGNVLSDDRTIIRFGHGSAETNERHLAVMHFKNLVEERSNGEIEVLVYPSEQLGSEAEMIESVSFNDLQMVAASAYSQYDKRISVFELPYLFDSYEEAWDVLDGPVGEEVAKPLLEDNLRIIAYFENGFRHVTSNVPIETPNDMKGIKIRTPEFPVSISTFRSFGSNPTPMAFGELYMGLQQGTVDAQENPVANTYANKFNEVQDYLNLTSHQYMPLPVAISEEFWQSLSDEEQEIIKNAALEAAQYHRDLIINNEEKMLADLKEKGMKIIESDVDAFREKVQPVHDSFTKQFGEDLINKIKQATEK